MCAISILCVPCRLKQRFYQNKKKIPGIQQTMIKALSCWITELVIPKQVSGWWYYRTKGGTHAPNGKNKTKQNNNEKTPNNLAIMIIGSGQIINWKKYFKQNSYSRPLQKPLCLNWCRSKRK